MPAHTLDLLKQKVGNPPLFDPTKAVSVEGMMAQFVEWIRWSERKRTVLDLAQAQTEFVNAAKTVSSSAAPDSSPPPL